MQPGTFELFILIFIFFRSSSLVDYPNSC